MTTAIKRRRGTTTQHSSFTGLEGELTVDTTKDTVVVHDGATAGGFPLLREDLANNTNVTTNAGSQTLTNKTLSSPTISGAASFASGSVSAPAITATGDTNTGIFFPAADTIAFTEGGVESMRLNSAGNLGVGTNSPTGRIHSATDAELTFNSTSITGTNSNYSRWSNTGGSLYIGVESSVGNRILSNSGAYSSAISTSNSTPLLLGTNNTERMRIDSSGNVGIGTNSPTERLEVSGNAAVTGIGYLALQRQLIPVGQNGVGGLEFRWYSTGTTYVTGARIGATTEAAWSSTSAPARLEFFTTASGSTTPSERMRITSAGSVGIGTSSPGTRLHITVDGTVDPLRIQSTQSGFERTWTIGPNVGANGLFAIRDTTAGANRINIDTSGNVGIGTSSPVSRLQVTDSLAITSAGGIQHLLIGNQDGAGTNQPSILRGVNGQLQFGVGNSWSSSTGGTFTERMRLDASGNLGLGVTPSAWGQGRALEVFQTGYGVWNGTHSSYLIANAYFNSGFKYANSGNAASHYYQFQGAHVWSTAPSGTAGNAITFTQAMTLDASGNLGIGTTSPTAMMDVNSNTVRVRTARTPASATATGNAGDICWDSNYVYVCVATNTWKRSALSTW